jgi:hypothetical protein
VYEFEEEFGNQFGARVTERGLECRVQLLEEAVCRAVRRRDGDTRSLEV